MFKVLEFQYDGKSSNDFGLKIVNFGGGGGINTDNLGVQLEIEEDKVKRNPRPFFYGVEVSSKLTFKLQLVYYRDNMTNKEIISRIEYGSIIKWLCKREYKEFKIIDTDYSNVIYNCIIQNPKQIEVGNQPYGIEVDVVCDRSWGIRKQTITHNVVNSLTFNLRNLGFDNDYIYPELQFTTTGGMSIRNNTDNTTMTFSGLDANETIYVDNQLQEIISSTGLNRNPNFNFNWFRITPDYYNNITITGNGTVTFRIEFPMPF